MTAKYNESVKILDMELQAIMHSHDQQIVSTNLPISVTPGRRGSYLVSTSRVPFRPSQDADSHTFLKLVGRLRESSKCSLIIGSCLI